MKDEPRFNVAYRRSFWKTVALVLGSGGFASAGFLMLATQPIVAAMTILFFGGCCVMAVWELLDFRPVVIINDVGICYRAVGMIEWKDISSVSLAIHEHHSGLNLILFDPDKYQDRMSPLRTAIARLNRRVGFGNIWIPLMLIQGETLDICEYVIKRIAAQNAERQSSDDVADENVTPIRRNPETLSIK